MELNRMLDKLGISDYESFIKIQGGTASTIYKIIVKNDSDLALRILPSNHYRQLLHEKQLMKFASQNEIPVPNVYEVAEFGDMSVMLMEWVSDKTVLQALLEQPERAYDLGVQFGKTQDKINKISPMKDFKKEGWHTQVSPEDYQHVEDGKMFKPEDKLLHLDYHPLNVLTDGKKITAVLDWTNAGFGDFRYDYVRTQSIIQLLAPTFFGENVPLTKFELGWKSGYKEAKEDLDYESIFNIWAGLAIKKDMEGKLTKEVIENINNWIEKWRTK